MLQYKTFSYNLIFNIDLSKEAYNQSISTWSEFESKYKKAIKPSYDNWRIINFEFNIKNAHYINVCAYVLSLKYPDLLEKINILK